MKCIFRVVHVTPLEFKMAANMAEVWCALRTAVTT